jgi:hypothetical protein
MRIDREGWMPTGEEEDTGDRLRPHTGKFCQERPSRRHRHIHQYIQTQMALARLQGVQNLLNPPPLQLGESAQANNTGEVIGLGVRDLIPGAKGGAQGGVGPVGIDIAGVLRQDCRDQFPERVVIGGPAW